MTKEEEEKKRQEEERKRRKELSEEEKQVRNLPPSPPRLPLTGHSDGVRDGPEARGKFLVQPDPSAPLFST